MTMTQGKFLLSFEKSAPGKEKDKLGISNNPKFLLFECNFYWKLAKPINSYYCSSKTMLIWVGSIWGRSRCLQD